MSDNGRDVTDLSPGSLLRDRYEVVARVARGSMADVFLARDVVLDRDVALKVLEGASDRGRSEATVVAALDHPNIVKLYEFFEFERRLYLVQEWMPAGTLDALLGLTGVLNLRQTLQLGLDVTAALAYAHRNAILHRDIKPSNVMLDEDGRYKLTDFGALGRLERDTGATRRGEVAGTPLYMAPEQFTGEAQSPATDLYALGLLLFRCLYGELPGGSSGNFVELYRGRSDGTLIVPPSPLQDLLRRCLAPNAERRPQSADQVRAELREVYQRSSPGAILRPTQPEMRRESPGDLSCESPHMATPERSAPIWSRSAGRLALAVAAVVVLTAVSTWILIRDGEGTGPRIEIDIAGPLLRVLLGLAIFGAGLASAWWIRARSSGSPDLERRAASIVLGAESREDLTRSLVIEVDQLVRRLETFDARFLGMSVIAMIHEYKESNDSSDRQSALINVVTLMEKVQIRLSPWPVRHKDAIASAVTIVSCVVAVASAVSGFLV